MAERSKISWTDATWNPWIGCTRISLACDNCYAADWAKRYGKNDLWNGQVQRTSVGNWGLPRRLERLAAKEGRRIRCFVASLSDFFDNRADPSWREDAWIQMRAAPSVDFQVLTKRAQNIAKMLPPDWGLEGYSNVWLGTTAEDEAHYQQRWRHISAVPAALRFLSYEPALGPIGDLRLQDAGAPGWVIAGGESGPKARPSHPDWFRSLRDQCASAGVPFHFKQWGTWAPGVWKPQRTETMSDHEYVEHAGITGATHVFTDWGDGHAFVRSLDHAPWSIERVEPAPDPRVHTPLVRCRDADQQILDGQTHLAVPPLHPVGAPLP